MANLSYQKISNRILTYSSDTYKASFYGLYKYQKFVFQHVTTSMKNKKPYLSLGLSAINNQYSPTHQFNYTLIIKCCTAGDQLKLEKYITLTF